MSFHLSLAPFSTEMFCFAGITLVHTKPNGPGRKVYCCVDDTVWLLFRVHFTQRVLRLPSCVVYIIRVYINVCTVQSTVCLLFCLLVCCCVPFCHCPIQLPPNNYWLKHEKPAQTVALYHCCSHHHHWCRFYCHCHRQC